MIKIALRGLYILVVLGCLLEVNPILVGAQREPPAPGELSGQITRPADNSEVRRQFNIEGTILNSNKARHLWAIVRIGDMHWPKGPELRPSGTRWRGVVNEGGRPPEGRFEVLLVDVSNEISQMFNDWQRTGDHTGNYPGIMTNELGDIRVLDQKEYRLR